MSKKQYTTTIDLFMFNDDGDNFSGNGIKVRRGATVSIVKKTRNGKRLLVSTNAGLRGWVDDDSIIPI